MFDLIYNLCKCAHEILLFEKSLRKHALFIEIKYTKESKMQIQDLSSRDVLLNVFSCLSVRELGVVAMVCDAWNKISSSDGAWRQHQICDEPTPSPIKEYTLWMMQKYFSVLKKLKTLPEKFPDFHSGIGYRYRKFTEESTWKDFIEIYGTDLDFAKPDYSKINWSESYHEAFEVVVVAFEVYLCLNKFGFTPLAQLEELAFKTRPTFLNPYPFQVLEEKYLAQGNLVKAEEMRQILSSWNDFVSHQQALHIRDFNEDPEGVFFED